MRNFGEMGQDRLLEIPAAAKGGRIGAQLHAAGIKTMLDLNPWTVVQAEAGIGSRNSEIPAYGPLLRGARKAMALFYRRM